MWLRNCAHRAGCCVFRRGKRARRKHRRVRRLDCFHVRRRDGIPQNQGAGLLQNTVSGNRRHQPFLRDSAIGEQRVFVFCILLVKAPEPALDKGQINSRSINRHARHLESKGEFFGVDLAFELTFGDTPSSAYGKEADIKSPCAAGAAERNISVPSKAWRGLLGASTARQRGSGVTLRFLLVAHPHRQFVVAIHGSIYPAAA
jgi:hypothetical protein